MRPGWLDPFRGLRALASWGERRAYDLRTDSLTAIGTALHGVEGRLVGELRAIEGRVLPEIAALRAEVADLRAKHGFVGDPVPDPGRGMLSGDPTRPRECKTGPTLEHRGSFIARQPKGAPSTRDERLPPGQNHP